MKLGFMKLIVESIPRSQTRKKMHEKDYFSLVSNIFELIARGVREENAVKCPVRIPTNERAIYYLNEYSLCVCLFLTARGLI